MQLEADSKQDYPKRNCQKCVTLSIIAAGTIQTCANTKTSPTLHSSNTRAAGSSHHYTKSSVTSTATVLPHGATRNKTYGTLLERENPSIC